MAKHTIASKDFSLAYGFAMALVHQGDAEITGTSVSVEMGANGGIVYFKDIGKDVDPDSPDTTSVLCKEKGLVMTHAAGLPV